ncbi:MAG: Na+:solute symporter [Flavobacteriales bacterium]|nr:Na+:solute symporter [Flavobacteriales bacterium]
MTLSTLDIVIIFSLLAIYLGVGIWSSKKSKKGSREFFLSGGNMPWWLLGVSMVATTFSADTPNLVTDIVRQNGVSGNWAWWAFLLTGMLTVFVYARLWRRSGITTDLEFYELRYTGKMASFLRGFRAIYLGVFFNVMIMATVSLAAIKIGGVILGLEPWVILAIAGTVTVLYSALGGLRAVILTDFIQFTIAMIGAVWAAATITHMPEVGGLDGLFTHENVRDKLNLLPDFSDSETLIPMLIIPLAVQWWSVWYPGSEPGGGGYVAQRMLSAKDEDHAMGATLFFQIAHYALRPWPWIIVALASLIFFPDLASIQAAFPHLSDSIIGHDLAYSAMLTFLPSGLIGIIIASLASAYMSTISTHLNWGSSYIVNDFYLRFMDKEASPAKQVSIGRASTVILMLLASFMALFLESALDAFNILLQIGAGTGLIFILRWFWWRINAYTEITGMTVSFLIAIYFKFIYTGDMADHWQLCWGVGITTIAWLTVTLLTRPEPESCKASFDSLIGKDAGHGMSMKILAMITGTISIYSGLFFTGYLLYGNVSAASISGMTLLIAGAITWTIWRRLKAHVS